MQNIENEQLEEFIKLAKELEENDSNKLREFKKLLEKITSMKNTNDSDKLLGLINAFSDGFISNIRTNS